VNGEPVLHRTWTEPSWGQSLLFVEEFQLTWYEHLKQNWRIPAAIAAIGALVMPFIFALAPTSSATHKGSYLLMVCLLLPLYFLHALQQQRQRHGLTSPHYLEVFRSGLYFWLHGFENGAHPFASFDHIKTALWHRKGNRCLFELTISDFSRTVELSIDRVDVARILSSFEDVEATQTPFFAALRACGDRNTTS
jgi:hypothetical protein